MIRAMLFISVQNFSTEISVFSLINLIHSVLFFNLLTISNRMIASPLPVIRYSSCLRLLLRTRPLSLIQYIFSAVLYLSVRWFDAALLSIKFRAYKLWRIQSDIYTAIAFAAALTQPIYYLKERLSSWILSKLSSSSKTLAPLDIIFFYSLPGISPAIYK